MLVSRAAWPFACVGKGLAGRMSYERYVVRVPQLLSFHRRNLQVGMLLLAPKTNLPVQCYPNEVFIMANESDIVPQMSPGIV